MAVPVSDLETLAKGLSKEHLNILDALASGDRLGLASRHQDKLRRKLRERGLIAHCGKPKRWQISADGLALRTYLMENPQ